MTKRRQPAKPTNVAAKALSDPAQRPRVVKPRKGRGSYVRQQGKSPPQADVCE